MKQPVAKKAVSALSKPSFEDYYKSIPEYKNDTVSYDLQSAYEELPYSQMKRFVESNAHLPDTYKKPTHPTFSNESKHHNDKTPGGYWDRDTKGRDRFTPSQYNIDNMGGPKEYMKWFQENEKGVILNMPYEQTQPTSFINNYFEDVVRAEKGLSLGFRTGEKWSVVEDLKGPSHADGGIDLFFNTDGLSFSRYGKTIKAEKGLIITNGVISGGDVSKLSAGVRPSADANTSNAPTSTIQPVNPNVNTSLIGKTWDDIPTNNPAYNQPQLKQDTRTDYERQRDQEAMTAYQNPTILEQVFGGARMVTRAVADPIQGIGQVFDAVGLGDTRIGQDLGNFNDEEAQYRYRNLNPNIDAGEKFMSNLGEGSEVAAYGATNFIPFESSVITPIVKGLVGKGNYSSHLANQLYSPVVNQGVKEVVEGSVVKQVDDVTENIIKTVDDDNAKYIAELRKELTENGIISKQKTFNMPYKENIRKGIEPWSYADEAPTAITNSKFKDVKGTVIDGKNPLYISEEDYLKQLETISEINKRFNLLKSTKADITYDGISDGRSLLQKEPSLKKAIDIRDANRINEIPLYDGKRSYVDLAQNRYATWDMYLGKPQIKHPLYDISELTTRNNVIYTIKDDFMNKSIIENKITKMINEINNPTVNKSNLVTIKNKIKPIKRGDSHIVIDEDKNYFGTMGGFHWDIKLMSDGNYKVMANDIWDLQPFKTNNKLPNVIKNMEVGKALGIGKPLNVQVGFIFDPKTKKIINTFGIAGIGTVGTIGASQENK